MSRPRSLPPLVPLPGASSPAGADEAAIARLIAAAADEDQARYSDLGFTEIGTGTSAGIRVTPDIALKAAVLHACIKVLAETIATLPIRMKRASDLGAVDAPEHPLDELIRYQPNRIQTAVEFWEMVVMQAALNGTGYAEIVPGPRGAVDQLVPLRRCEPERLRDGSLRFQVSDPVTGRSRVLLQEEVFRIPGMSSDGVRGLRAVDLAADDIGLGMAADAYAARVFSNKLNIGGFLVHPKKLDRGAQRNLIHALMERFAGTENAHRPILLQEGMKFERATMDADKAQLLEARKWQITLVAMRWRIPLHMLGIYDGATHSNVEQQALDLVRYTIRPWVKRIEQAIRRDLVIATRSYWAEFNLEGLLRGDSQARAAYFTAALGSGGHAPWMTVNEVRRIEGYNDVPGGDVIRWPSNEQKSSAPAPSAAALEDQSTPLSGTPAAIGQVGFPYDFLPTITGGTGQNRSATLEGALRPGLSFSSLTGRISGSATSSGVMAGLVITVSEPGLAPATLNLQDITINAAPATQTPFIIAPGKVLAWFDATDVATMFQDSGNPIVPNGTETQRSIGEIRAKTPANPAGDPAWPAVQATQARKPVYSATAYAGGLAAGIEHAQGQFLCMRNKSIGGGNTLSLLAAVRLTATGAIAAFGLADQRGGLSGRNAGGALYIDQGDYIAFQSGSGGEIGAASPVNVTQNYEFAADSGTYRIYRGGTQIASGTASNTFDNPLDFSIFNNGAYQNDGTTPSNPNIGAPGSWQHYILLSSPLSASERTAMQAWLLEKAGGSSYTITGLKQTATTGSMAAGSSALTVASAAGWADDDPIIVEPTTGYGTVGPGGAFPALAYADESTLLAQPYSNPSTWARAFNDGKWKVYEAKRDKAYFTASRSGTTLTITALAADPNGFVQPIRLGGQLGGDGVTSHTIEEQLSGSSGGVGTYRTSGSQTLASQDMTAFGGGGYYEWAGGRFYLRYCIPLPLVTTVQSGGGTTALTLAAPSQVALSGAGVKYNIRPRLQAQLTGPEGADFTIPPGTYWMDRGVSLTFKSGWTIKGASLASTVLKTARGGASTFFDFVSCISPSVTDMTLIGQHGYNGGAGLIYSGPNEIAGYGDALSFRASTGPMARDILAIDYMNCAVSINQVNSSGGRSQPTESNSRNNNGFLLRCEARLTQANQTYIQWAISTVQSTNIEVRDCKVAHVRLGCGFESFASSGTIFTRPVMQNGLWSLNSAGGTIIDHPVQTFTENCRDLTMLNPIKASLIGINGNVDFTSGISAGSGGQIINPTIIAEGWFDTGGYVPPTITIDRQPGWTITGTYNPAVKDDGNRKGLIRIPAPKAGLRDTVFPPSSPNYNVAPGPHINFGSDKTVIDGLWLDRLPVAGSEAWPSFPKSIATNLPSAPESSVTNTITGTASTDINAPGAAQSGNVSGNAYAALP